MMKDHILTAIGLVLIASIIGVAWYSWYSNFHDYLDDVSACDTRFREEYREANVPLNMDPEEIWTLCAAEVRQGR